MKLPLNPTDLDSLALNTFETSVEGVNGNLKAQLEKVQNAIMSVKDLISDVEGNINEQMNLDDILKSIDDFWMKAENESELLIQRLHDQFDPLADGLPILVKPMSVVLYSVGGFFLLMVVIAFLMGARMLYRAFRDRLYNDPDIILVGE